jgi:hypothetical protein
MRVLAVRAGSVDRDIAAGRAALAATIAHPSTTVMVIRWIGPEVAAFADRAAGRTDPFPWRDAVWVTDPRIFEEGQEAALFGGHESACAVVLDLRDLPVAWLNPDAELFDIDDAFLTAGRRRSAEIDQ